ASIGTPFGSSHSGAITGHWPAGTAKRELGCAAGNFESAIHGLPCQSVRPGGGVSVRPSHHTSPSAVSATLGKTVFLSSVCSALLLVFSLVPGATPKKPASGLMA